MPYTGLTVNYVKKGILNYLNFATMRKLNIIIYQFVSRFGAAAKFVFVCKFLTPADSEENIFLLYFQTTGLQESLSHYSWGVHSISEDKYFMEDWQTFTVVTIQTGPRSGHSLPSSHPVYVWEPGSKFLLAKFQWCKTPTLNVPIIIIFFDCKVAYGPKFLFATVPNSRINSWESWFIFNLWK